MSSASMHWIKLYTDMLHDFKIKKLTEVQRWRFVQLLLLAGDCDESGALVSGDKAMTLDDIALALNVKRGRLQDDLDALVQVGLITINPPPVRVVNFAKRQGRSQEDRRAQWNKSKRKTSDFGSGLGQVGAKSGPVCPQVVPTQHSEIPETGQKHRENRDIPVGFQRQIREEKIREERERDESGSETSGTSDGMPSHSHSVLETKDIVSVADSTKPASVNPPTWAVPPRLRNQPAPKKQRHERDVKPSAIETLKANPAIQLYFETFLAWPNPSQMRMIAEFVSDTGKWNRVITDWDQHGWKRHNVPGMIERYLDGKVKPPPSKPDAPTEEIVSVYRNENGDAVMRVAVHSESEVSQ